MTSQAQWEEGQGAAYVARKRERLVTAVARQGFGAIGIMDDPEPVPCVPWPPPPLLLPLLPPRATFLCLNDYVDAGSTCMHSPLVPDAHFLIAHLGVGGPTARMRSLLLPLFPCTDPQ